jgi:hypothetical protein
MNVVLANAGIPSARATWVPRAREDDVSEAAGYPWIPPMQMYFITR